jgi:transposase
VAGRITGQQAADVLGITLRHARRILARYRQEGAAALAHGNRGRTPVNKLDESVEAEIVCLASGEYHDYNDSLFTNGLGERHEIQVAESKHDRQIAENKQCYTPARRWSF